MLQGSNLMSSLSIRESWLKQCLDHLESLPNVRGPDNVEQAVMALYLNTDIIMTCKIRTLPMNLENMHKQRVFSDAVVILQIDKIDNISDRIDVTAEEPGSMKLIGKANKLTLSDGHTQCIALDFGGLLQVYQRSISIRPGCKIALKNTLVRRGALILDLDCCCILGGSVTNDGQAQITRELLGFPTLNSTSNASHANAKAPTLPAGDNINGIDSDAPLSTTGAPANVATGININPSATSVSSAVPTTSAQIRSNNPPLIPRVAESTIVLLDDEDDDEATSMQQVSSGLAQSRTSSHNGNVSRTSITNAAPVTAITNTLDVYSMEIEEDIVDVGSHHQSTYLSPLPHHSIQRPPPSSEIATNDIIRRRPSDSNVMEIDNDDEDNGYNGARTPYHLQNLSNNPTTTPILLSLPASATTPANLSRHADTRDRNDGSRNSLGKESLLAGKVDIQDPIAALFPHRLSLVNSLLEQQNPSGSEIIAVRGFASRVFRCQIHSTSSLSSQGSSSSQVRSIPSSASSQPQLQQVQLPRHVLRSYYTTLASHSSTTTPHKAVDKSSMTGSASKKGRVTQAEYLLTQPPVQPAIDIEVIVDFHDGVSQCQAVLHPNLVLRFLAEQTFGDNTRRAQSSSILRENEEEDKDITVDTKTLLRLMQRFQGIFLAEVLTPPAPKNGFDATTTIDADVMYSPSTDSGLSPQHVALWRERCRSTVSSLLWRQFGKFARDQKTKTNNGNDRSSGRMLMLLDMYPLDCTCLLA